MGTAISSSLSPDCCYYLHCGTLRYPVKPIDTNDRLNADQFKAYRENDTLTNQIHLVLSATSLNLQDPKNNTVLMDGLNRVRRFLFSVIFDEFNGKSMALCTGR